MFYTTSKNVATVNKRDEKWRIDLQKSGSDTAYQLSIKFDDKAQAVRHIEKNYKEYIIKVNEPKERG